MPSPRHQGPGCALPEIAVIGAAARYAGAKNIKEFYENVVGRRREFRRIPPERLPLADYYSADKDEPDKTYGTRGAYIDGFRFDWAGERIPYTTFQSADIVHWLAARTGKEALIDAGYDRETVGRDRTAVIVGNSLTGEWTRSRLMRLRWPFARRMFLRAAVESGVSEEAIEAILARAEPLFKSVSEPIGPESLAGALSNTIAGRLCNMLDVRGGGFTVDAACASGLLAIVTAIQKLALRECDLVLAGGVDLSLDPMELVGFSKAGALSDGDMNVYDQAARGFLPGEGCGFAVLKRLDDARRDGDTVLAIVDGWGVSSDGKGGIMAPSRDGQAEAIRRAYRVAGASIRELDFIEGHGTGTPLGDATELRAISAAYGTYKPGRDGRIGMTSAKSIIGHTKAAAGAAAFLKAVVCLNRRVIPPTAGCRTPSDVFASDAPMLYPILLGEVRDPGDELRAGCSAMGFGGINVHVSLRSADPPSRGLEPSVPERSLLVSPQETELFVLGGPTAESLVKQAEALAPEAERMSDGQMADLAALKASELPGRTPVRAALVADSPAKLAEALRDLVRSLSGRDLSSGELRSGDGWRASRDMPTPRVGFLLPGQGSQRLQAGRVIAERYPWGRRLLEQSETWAAEVGGLPVAPSLYRPTDRATPAEIEAWEAELAETRNAQPAVVLPSLLLARLLREMGVRPDVLLGHSLGELTALHLAGAFDEEALFKLTSVRAQAMGSISGDRGAMLALDADTDEATALVRGLEGVSIAAKNGSRQTVIAGDSAAILEAEKRAAERGIRASRLRTGGAFHTRLMDGAATQLRRAADLLPAKLGETRGLVVSSRTGAPLRAGVKLIDHLAWQMVEPVDFVSALATAGGLCDLLLEVGPGRVLTGLAAGAGLAPCLPIASRDDGRDLNEAVATLFVRGADLNFRPLYEHRLIRPFEPFQKLEFIDSPTERALAAAGATDSGAAEAPRGVAKPTTKATPPTQPRSPAPRREIESTPTPAVAPPSDPGADELLLIRQLVSRATSFALDNVRAEHRFTDDLNLTSIKATEIVVSAAGSFGVRGKVKPRPLILGTLRDAAEAIRAARSGAPTDPPPAPSPPGGSPHSNGRPTDTAPLPTGRAKAEAASARIREFAVRQDSGERVGRHDAAVRSAVVLSEPEESAIAEAIAGRLRDRGAVVRTGPYPTGPEPDAEDPIGQRIVILPRRPETGEPPERALARLFAGTTGPAVEGVAFVQFGRGDSAAVESSSSAHAGAFARSLWLERRDLRVRVIELPGSVDPATAADRVLGELGGPGGFQEAMHDPSRGRLVPRTELLDPESYRPRPQPIEPGEVILAAGGGRGVTAECVLRLAIETRAKAALLGRGPETDPEVRATLERFRAEGLDARYYRADVIDADAVRDAVGRIRRELGTIAVAVHGAGTNSPCLLEHTAPTLGLDEVGPKVLGFRNLAAAMEAEPPRVFAALTSIIGVSGMEGNAWYALANEWLADELNRWRRAHPGSSTISLAFSVWDEVGMGARLGSIEGLARRGISAIPPLEGARRFVHLVTHDPGHDEVVIAGDLGDLPTFPAPASTRGRFLEEIVSHEPGKALTARARLIRWRDLYLADHVFRGETYFATVFGLEAMVQGSAMAAGIDGRQIREARNVRLDLPLLVPPDAPLEIEINARVVGPEGPDGLLVRAGIRPVGADQGGEDYFTATFLFAPPLERAETFDHGPLEPLAIDPRTDLYGSGLLFQGPRYRRIGEVYKIDGKTAVVKVGAFDGDGPEGATFGDREDPEFLLGDPYARDGLLQVVQLITPDEICLPVEIDLISWPQGPPGSAADRIVTARLIARDDSTLVEDVVATDPSGRVLERLSNYRLRIMETRPEGSSASRRIGEIATDEARILAEVAEAAVAIGVEAPSLALSFVPGLHGEPIAERRRRETPTVARALRRYRGGSSAVFELGDDGGRPLLIAAESDEAGLSIAHDDQFLLCAVGEAPQGCDLEPIEPRSPEEWANLLEKPDIDLLDRMADSEPSERAGTRIWVAREAVFKAQQRSGPRLRVVASAGEAVLLGSAEGEDEHLVLTLPIRPGRKGERMLGVSVRRAAGRGAPDRPPASPESGARNGRTRESILIAAGKGTPAPHVRTNRWDPLVNRSFAVSLKDCAGPGGRVGIGAVAGWLGKVREAALGPIGRRLLDDLRSGKFALLTRSASAGLRGGAVAFDRIDPELRLVLLNDREFTIRADFRLDGDPAFLAWGIVEVLGVEPSGSASSLPEYLTDHLATLPRIEPSADEGDGDFGPDRREMLSLPGHSLHVETFRTTPEDGNIAGNVYFREPLLWQDRLAQAFLHDTDPGLFPIQATDAWPASASASMEFLGECRPFETIRAELSAVGLGARSVDLACDLFRDETGDLLATGRHLIVLPAGRRWPDPLRSALVGEARQAAEAARSTAEA